VPPNALNKFTYKKGCVVKNQETGEVTSVKFMYVLDTQKVIEWWEGLGFPAEVTENKKEKSK
jgi:hypothetical protein